MKTLRVSTYRASFGVKFISASTGDAKYVYPAEVRHPARVHLSAFESTLTAMGDVR